MFLAIPRGLWEVINIEQTGQGTCLYRWELLRRVQARVSHVHQPTGKVRRRPRNCCSGIGYADNAGADCLGAEGDQRTNARTGTPRGPSLKFWIVLVMSQR